MMKQKKTSNQVQIKKKKRKKNNFRNIHEIIIQSIVAKNLKNETLESRLKMNVRR